MPHKFLKKTQSVVTLCKREVDRLSSLTLRLKHAADHFDSRGAGVNVAKWMSGVVTGYDEIANAKYMIVHTRDNVVLSYRLSVTGCGERNSMPRAMSW